MTSAATPCIGTDRPIRDVYCSTRKGPAGHGMRTSGRSAANNKGSDELGDEMTHASLPHFGFDTHDSLVYT